MDLEFPRMMYRAGSACVLESGTYDLRLVKNVDDMAAATDEGWHRDQYAAKAAHGSVIQPAERTAADVAADIAPPTRAELEQKATELGLKFDGRTSDKKLAATIADKLKA